MQSISIDQDITCCYISSFRIENHLFVRFFRNPKKKKKSIGYAREKFTQICQSTQVHFSPLKINIF